MIINGVVVLGPQQGTHNHCSVREKAPQRQALRHRLNLLSALSEILRSDYGMHARLY